MLPQTKVFVGSLPQGTKPEELRSLFERFGAVTECDIMNRCGFVHMQSEDQAAAAIRALHNTTFNGGVITVEKGRVKERGGRGGVGGGGGMRGMGRGGRGGGGMRGGGSGMRGGGGDRRPGGPMRGGHMGGHRDAPYQPRERPHMGGGGMGARNGMGGGGGGGYDRGMDRGMGGGGGGGYADDRYGGGYAEDRRGFALMEGRGARADPYAQAPMYADDRRGGYGAPPPVDDMGSMYPDERRAPMYPDEREMMDRRPPMREAPMMNQGYDRSIPKAGPMGNGDMYNRRAPMHGSGTSGGYDRDPYAQQYAPPMPRGGGRGGGRDHGGMAPRRY